MAEPVRTCVVCRMMAEKESLHRFIWNESTVQLDLTQMRQGRGVYCCGTEKCLRRFLTQERKWRKIFKK